MEAAARLCFRKFIAIEHLHAPLSARPSGVRPSTSHLASIFGGLGIWWHRQRFSGYLRSVFPEKVICVSNALAETLRSDYVYPEAKVITAYSGIDTTVFRPDPLARSRARQTWDIPATAFVFGSVGRLSPMKNHAQLVHAFHTLLYEDPGKDLRLVIVGEGPQRESLETLTQSCGLEGKVLLAGFSAKPEEVVPAFDVFCFPSLTGESLGLTLLETMSCEIPAIASAVGGVPEILNSDQLGWLIPPNDEDALRTAMRKAAMAPASLLTSMGKLARERVIEHFEARKRWKELVEQICDPQTGKRKSPIQ
jgi:glycosyltransferase involved in cell wall biosynthesis